MNSEAFEAFRLAHKNMGAIQIMTGRIPGYHIKTIVLFYQYPKIFFSDYMREAVKLLLGDNKRAIERHLPIHLEEIRDIAEEVLTSRPMFYSF